MVIQCHKHNSNQLENSKNNMNTYDNITVKLAWPGTQARMHADRETDRQTIKETDRQIVTYTKVITEESPFRALGVPSLQPIIKERSNTVYRVSL